MASPHDRLRLRPVSLRQERDKRVLLVWGDVGQWLVVDAEAAQLMRQFDELTRVDEAIQRFAQQAGKTLDEVAADSLGAVNALERRGLLVVNSPQVRAQVKSWQYFQFPCV